jgi:hypothetical protein
MNISDLEHLRTCSNICNRIGGHSTKHILAFNLTPTTFLLSFDRKEIFSGKLSDNPSVFHFSIGDLSTLKLTLRSEKISDIGKWTAVVISSLQATVFPLHLA